VHWTACRGALCSALYSCSDHRELIPPSDRGTRIADSMCRRWRLREVELHQMTKIEERELWSIAAFRLRESANKILALADRAESAVMRKKLLSICARLAKEEQRLLAFANRGASDVPDDHAAGVPAATGPGNGRAVYTASGGAAEQSPDRALGTSPLHSCAKLKSWQS
jgi:hypothetical protein